MISVRTIRSLFTGTAISSAVALGHVSIWYPIDSDAKEKACGRAPKGFTYYLRNDPIEQVGIVSTWSLAIMGLSTLTKNKSIKNP